MKHLHTYLPGASAAALAAAALCATAPAQTLLTDPNYTTVIATDGDNAPGCPGDVFGGATALANIPYLGLNGNVAFLARLSGVATPVNDRAIFIGSNRANLTLALRNGDPAPGLPGLTLSNGTSGISGMVRMVESGRLFFGSYLSSGNAADDTALIVGFPGSFQILAREGDPAPGISGAIMAGTNFATPAAATTGMNANGDCCFNTALSGPGVTTANNTVWYVGQPGALQIAQRKGDTVLGGAEIASFGPISQINAAGQFLYDATLSTTTGTTPANFYNDRCMFVYTPGVGSALLAREGAPAPGTVGATFNAWATGGGGIGTNWVYGTSGEGFTNAGVLFYADLYGGDATYGVSDKALYLGSPSGLTMVARRGDPVAGLPGLYFADFHTSGMVLSASGRIAFRGRLGGPGVTTANDNCIFAGTPGALSLVLREGELVPGTGGTYAFGDPWGLALCQNDLGQLIFDTAMVFVGGTSNVPGRWCWDPLAGRMEVCRTGDLFEVSPGTFKWTSGKGDITGAMNNGNGAQGCLSNDGHFTMTVPFTDGTRAVVTIEIPHVAVPTNYCTAGTTSNGCVAAIGGSGTPSATAGSGFTISATGVEGQKLGLVFYGLSGPHAGAWGTGSSFLCVKPPTQRTPAHNSNGTAGLCDGTLSVDWNAYIATNAGALGVPFAGGETVWAQAWFRDPPAPKTTSLSDGLQFTVQP